MTISEAQSILHCPDAYGGIHGKKYGQALAVAIKALEQEPKTGHWEWVQYESNPNIGNWHCSECNRLIVCGAIKTANPVRIYKYCPNCGAKMVEPQENGKSTEIRL